MEIFFFLPKQSKNLDPSYEMDLDLWDCFMKGKTGNLQKNFIGLIKFFAVILEKGNPCVIAR